MTKQETMRLLLIDVRAYLRNRSMDAVYEQGRREGLLQAINAALEPSVEPTGNSCTQVTYRDPATGRVLSEPVASKTTHTSTAAVEPPADDTLSEEMLATISSDPPIVGWVDAVHVAEWARRAEEMERALSAQRLRTEIDAISAVEPSCEPDAKFNGLVTDFGFAQYQWALGKALARKLRLRARLCTNTLNAHRTGERTLNELVLLQLLDLLGVRMDSRVTRDWSRDRCSGVACVLLASGLLPAIGMGCAPSQTQAEDS